MQVGGVQDAIMVAPPPVVDAVAPPLLLTLTEAASEELQVSGTPVIVVPRVSRTVGAIVFEVLLEDVTASAIDCTAQVVKLTGTLLALPMEAKIGVRPGAFAVAWTCPGSKPVTVVLSVATFANRVCQVKIPTVEVMSVPRLYAVAWYSMAWPTERHGVVGGGGIGLTTTLSTC